MKDFTFFKVVHKNFPICCFIYEVNQAFLAKRTGAVKLHELIGVRILANRANRIEFSQKHFGNSAFE